MSAPTSTGTEFSFTLTGPATPLRRLAADAWRARNVLILLSRREFFAKYRRASFGVLWAVLLPLVQAAVLGIVLRRFVRFETGDNYIVYIFGGTVPWTFFSTSLTAGTTSIVDNADVSSKIYFPRLIFPLTAIGSNVYGMLISAVILLGIALATGTDLGLRTLLLIPAAALLIVFTSAVSLMFSALHVYFRDMRYLVQAGLLPLFYLTPIFYPLDAVRELRRYIHVNPVTGIVEMFHAATVGAERGWTDALWWTLGWTALVLIVGLWLHQRHDRVFSDLL